MTLTKFNLPNRHLGNRRMPAFGSFFDEFLNGTNSEEYETASKKRRPAVNISETANSFLVEVAAPGFEKSDFKVEVDEKQLIISSKKESDQAENTHYTKREFTYSSFERVFTLPETIKDSKISAEYLNGILKLTLPKMEEAVVQPAREVKIS